MIVIFTGRPGAGKSLKMSDTLVSVLYRNKKWYAQTKIVRPVYSNLRVSRSLEAEFKLFIKYWTDPSELVDIRDADVFWDEIATHLDSTQWQNMSLYLKRWLQQHRKFGIEIYGTTQDFAMIDKSMRRMTSDLFYITKLFGSRDISSTAPKPRFIYGLSLVKRFDPTTYDEENKQTVGFPSLLYISRKSVGVFDTTQEIEMGEYPPLNHVDRSCAKAGCGFHKVIHA